MTNWSPPTLSAGAKALLAVGFLAVLAYTLLVIQQVLVAVVVGGLLGLAYFMWRSLAAFEAMAEALQRLADDRTE